MNRVARNRIFTWRKKDLKMLHLSAPSQVDATAKNFSSVWRNGVPRPLVMWWAADEERDGEGEDNGRLFAAVAFWRAWKNGLLPLSARPSILYSSSHPSVGDLLRHIKVGADELPWSSRVRQWAESALLWW